MLHNYSIVNVAEKFVCMCLCVCLLTKYGTNYTGVNSILDTNTAAIPETVQSTAILLTDMRFIEVASRVPILRTLV